MALGMITAGLGIAQGVGGLLGGGGPRQPRMNRQQKELLKSQADKNKAMAKMMRMMTKMMGKMQHGMMGKPCGHPQGNCCQRGMNGANSFGGPGGFPNNPMGNMFNLNLGNLPPGTNVNINLGGAGQQFPPFGGGFGGGFPFAGGLPPFNQLPQAGLSFAAGVSMSMYG